VRDVAVTFFLQRKSNPFTSPKGLTSHGNANLAVIQLNSLVVAVVAVVAMAVLPDSFTMLFVQDAVFKPKYLSSQQVLNRFIAETASRVLVRTLKLQSLLAG
jgi:hypothetical protein